MPSEPVALKRVPSSPILDRNTRDDASWTERIGGSATAAAGADAQRLESLTSLRFAFALVVVLGHARIFFSPNLSFMGRVPGRLAVAGFFILSGFILYHVYERSDFSASATRRDYFVRRFARIYPVYLLALCAYLPLRIGLGVVIDSGRLPAHALPAALQAYLADSSALNFLAQAFGLQSIVGVLWTMPNGWNGPGWSISTELFFYAVFPVLLPLLREIRSQRFTIILLALTLFYASGVCFAYSTLPGHGGWAAFIYVHPVTRIGEFVVGMLLYKLNRTLTLGRLSLVATLCLTAIVPLGIAAFGWQASFLVLLWLAALLVCLANYNPRVLRARVLVLLGEASYALYLTHHLFLIISAVALRQHRPVSPALLTVVIGLNVLLAILIYRFFEVPTRRLLVSRLSSSARAPQPQATGNA